MAVESPEAMPNIGHRTREGSSLPVGNVREALREFYRSVRWKALEIATTHQLVSAIVYKLGIIKWGPPLGPDCAFPIGHPHRVVGKIE